MVVLNSWCQKKKKSYRERGGGGWWHLFIFCNWRLVVSDNQVHGRELFISLQWHVSLDAVKKILPSALDGIYLCSNQYPSVSLSLSLFFTSSDYCSYSQKTWIGLSLISGFPRYCNLRKVYEHWHLFGRVFISGPIPGNTRGDPVVILFKMYFRWECHRDWLGIRRHLGQKFNSDYYQGITWFGGSRVEEVTSGEDETNIQGVEAKMK